MDRNVSGYTVAFHASTKKVAWNPCSRFRSSGTTSVTDIWEPTGWSFGHFPNSMSEASPKLSKVKLTAPFLPAGPQAGFVGRPLPANGTFSIENLSSRYRQQLILALKSLLVDKNIGPRQE